MWVPESAGVGMAKVTIAFDSWKETPVAPTTHEIPVALPKASNVKLAAVSTKLKHELIHPNKTSNVVGIRFSADGKRLLAGDYPGGVGATGRWRSLT